MPWPLIAMAALTAAKMYSDSQKEDRDRKLQAATARYSPWTGMKPDAVKQADLPGTAMQGLAAGLAFDQANAAGSPQAMQTQPMQTGGWMQYQKNPYMYS